MESCSKQGDTTLWDGDWLQGKAKKKRQINTVLLVEGNSIIF